ncbi:MAG: sugar transferase [Clostridiales bacterium]|jgi:exopolysaccharide biosynthesis polyprenyl glycosylphosphotransferase|nr:sugar transferase [Clostridiales bacterium]
MKNNSQAYQIFKIFIVFADVLILCGCILIALYFPLPWVASNLEERNIQDISRVLPFICVGGVFLLYVYNLYSDPGRSVFDIVYSVILVVLFLTVITMALSFFLRSSAFPRTIIAYNAGLQAVLLTLWRISALYIGRKLHGKQTVLIVGHEPETQEIAKKILLTPGSLYEIKYLFDLSKDYKIMRKLIQNVDQVFICPNITPKERQKIFSSCVALNTNIFMIPTLFEISVKNAALQNFDDMPAFRIGQIKLTWEQKTVKRLFDIIFSVVSLVLTSPILLISAIAIKLDSPGPVFYRQERITENNRVFKVIKLRTMQNGAEELTGSVLAAENDPRITKVGAFLRATRVDELPQFINVFLGDMSVVGPRPERPIFTEQFKMEQPDYDYRSAVKAGITGYAQVMGKYTTSFTDKLRYDLMYIRNYSLWLDITLVIQTIKVLFTKQAAVGVVDDYTFKDSLAMKNIRLVHRDGYDEALKAGSV